MSEHTKTVEETTQEIVEQLAELSVDSSIAFLKNLIGSLESVLSGYYITEEYEEMLELNRTKFSKMIKDE